MLKTVIWIVLTGCTIYVLLGVVLYALQRSLLYYPTPAVNVDSRKAEVIWLSNEKQTLKVWHVKGDNGTALLYFGGNAEDVALNIDAFKKLFPGYSIYLQNYRGYGGSSGKPTERGLFSDAAALYDMVRKDHAAVSALGRSLGTGVAVYLASVRDIQRLALVTPYDSMTHLASTYYSAFPVSLLLKDRFDSGARAADLAVPTLVLIAEKDEVIPAGVSDSLRRLLPSGYTRVEVIKGAGHNTIDSFPGYADSLYTFFAGNLTVK